MLRHLVFVQEETSNPTERLWSTYLDGSLVLNRTVRKGSAAEFDRCNNLIFAGTLGDPDLGAAPNQGFRGVVQQWHLYESTALSAQEVEDIHFQATDPDTGLQLRECLLNDDAVFDSSDAVDVAGHDCAWYYEAKLKYPALCNIADIRKKCPLACGVRRACWSWQELFQGPSYTVSRMWRFTSEGAAAVENGAADAPLQTCFVKERLDELGENCCEQGACHPSCTFSAPWRLPLTERVQESDSWTLATWIKLAGDEDDFRSVSFFGAQNCNSKVTLVNISIDQPNNALEVHVRLPDGGGTVQDPVYTSHTYIKRGTFSTTSWTLLVISISRVYQPTNQSTSLPQRYLTLTVNSRSLRIPTSDPANQRQGQYSFDENIRLWDGFDVEGDMLVGVPEIIAFELPPWGVQDYYYRYRAVLDVRQGPSQPVSDLDNHQVPFHLNPFRSPALLLAPPLLLQSRHATIAGGICPTKAATQALDNIGVLVRAQCAGAPYVCPAKNLSSVASYVLECKVGDDDVHQDVHFGRNAITVDSMDDGKYFGEFLFTTSEASIVGRSGQAYATKDFIDSHAHLVRLFMVLIAPDFKGRVSTISVEFEVKSRVKASYQVQHFRTMDDKSTAKYVFGVTILFVLAGLLFWDGLLRLLWTWKRGRGRLKKIVVFDVIFSALVLFEYGVTLRENMRSTDVLVNHLNVLMTEDRWSRDESLEMKVQDFVKDIGKLEADINFQANLRLAHMLLAGFGLWRLIIATQTHPRIAILMDTVVRGFDALIHYFLLLVLIFWSFVFLGVLSFGGSHEEFGSIGGAIEVIATVMLQGEFPEDTLKQTPAYILYILSCVVIFFFLMLNFVLAIIVDMYAKVQRALDELEIEQFVFTDILSTVQVFLRRWCYCWPHHKQIIEALQQQAARNSCTIDSLGAVSESWSRRSRVRFVQYYRNHEFLAPKVRESGQVEAIARETERRIAVLLGIPPASEFDHAVSKARLLRAGSSNTRSTTSEELFKEIQEPHVPTEMSPSAILPKLIGSLPGSSLAAGWTRFPGLGGTTNPIIQQLRREKEKECSEREPAISSSHTTSRENIPTNTSNNCPNSPVTAIYEA